MENFYTSRIHGFPNLTVRGSIVSAVPEEGVISLIVVLGSSVSLVGLVFAFITYSLFSDLRSLSGTTLMNLLAALFMTQLLYVIGVGGVQDAELCIGLAFSLQYIRLTVFCWLAVMTHHMYTTFKDNVNLIPTAENNITSMFWKYSLFSWGVPLAFLTGSIILQMQQRNGKLLDTSGIKHINCWFLDQHAFVYGFVLPMTVLLLITTLYLARSAVVIRYTVSMQIDRRTRDKMRKKRRLQLLLFIKVTFILTIVASLGVMARLTGINSFWIGFNVGHGLQGIAIALCVTCNCQVLKIYTRSFKKRKAPQYGGVDADGNIRPYASTELSKSTSLQLLMWTPAPDAV